MTKKSTNSALHKASKQKKDEFYTQLSDIEKELKNYRDQFHGKIVYCNCDDPYESNFFKYFAANFNALKLKKLITTTFNPSPIAGGQLPLLDLEGLKPDAKQPFKIEICEVNDLDGDGAVGLVDVELLLRSDVNVARPLDGDGDFRSKECIELLQECDVVVTNPPFSLFREYIELLNKHEKQFLILGNQNAIKYNYVFKLIKDNKVWLGYDNGGTKWFQVPDDYDIKTESRKKIENGVKYFSMGSIVWFTNMDTAKRHQKLSLYKKYSPDEYPQYDNYDAINVNRYIDIPQDFDGEMGVPITFIGKYNPEQFEIIAIFDDKREKSEAFVQGDPTYVDEQHKKYVGPVIDGKALYTRVLIKSK